MSCSPIDLMDYFLKELPDAERRRVEAHITSCGNCRQELERLRLTQTTLFALRDEEVPQRIAFVSDKIFEQPAWRRAWESFWGSAARLGFASAAMLSVALVVFALARPAGHAPAPPVAAIRIQPLAIAPADLQKEIQTAVAEAVAASEAEQEKKMEARISEVRQLALWAEADRDISRRRALVFERSSYGPQTDDGGPK